MSDVRAAMKRRGFLTLLLLFTSTYAVLETAYCFIPDEALVPIYQWLIAAPAAQLLRVIASADHVHVVSNLLMSDHVGLRIVRGCDASGVLFLLFAAIIMIPAPLAQKWRGMLGAIAVTYALNELRVLALYWTQRLNPHSFTLMHVYLLPLAILLFSALFFVSWQRGTQQTTLQQASRLASQ